MKPACGPDFLGPLLGHATHLARERMDARLSRYDMTPSQTHTLLYLSSHGYTAPQRDVVEHLRVRPSTANGILDRMEEKGLIRRTADENDQRQKQVTATEKGRELNSLVPFRRRKRSWSRGCGWRRLRLCGCFCTVSSRI